jgi:hypothetical protein
LFAVLLIVLFVVVLPVVLLAYNSVSVALSPAFLDAALADTRLYERGLAAAAEDLARQVPWESETRGLAIARLDAQDWERILIVVAPPSSVRQWVGDAMHEFRRWRWGSDSPLDEVVVPYGEMRDNLVNDPDQTALRAITEAQPPCAAGEEPLAGAADLIPGCRPVAADLETFYADLGTRWREEPQAVWQQLWPRDDMRRHSDNITLGELIRRDAAQHTSWRGLRTNWRLAGWTVSLAQGLAVLTIVGGVVVTMAIVAALAARNRAEMLRWVGGPTLLAGLFTFVWGLAILVGGWIEPQWSDLSGVTPAMRGAVRDIARLFTSKTFVAMAWQGMLLAVGGLALWGSSFLLRKPRPQV